MSNKNHTQKRVDALFLRWIGAELGALDGAEK